MIEGSSIAQNKVSLEFFESMRAHESVLASTRASDRIKKLKSMEKLLLSRRLDIHKAICEDFRKPNLEIDAVEIYPVVKEIRHSVRNLRSWMNGKPAGTPLAFIGSRSKMIPEPKGVSLIISPWNYPFNLTLGPLVHAIAAGCPAVLKPSEYVPHIGDLMEEVVRDLFPPDEVTLVQGGEETGRALLKLPFRHIYFTGSAYVGKKVMRAAADHLASVTLELGGKSPAVVESTANLKVAARRIAQTKWVNAGQTCIAPDYVLVDQRVEKAFTRELKSYTEKYFPWQQSPEAYASIINMDHRKRLEGYLADAIEHGADLWSHGKIHSDHLQFPPTLVFNASLSNRLMQEEIFGPILPIIPFNTIDQATDIINLLDRPLTLSVFSARQSVIDTVLGKTRAGNTCINHCSVHYYNSNIPFGGINESGIGKGHGYYGFMEFSNARAVLRQTWPYSPHEWLHHPYSSTKQRFVDLILKWL